MLKKVLVFLIFSRLALFVYAGGVLDFSNHWDGQHYIYLSENGYTNHGDEANFIVFLPFYPVLIKIFNLIINNSLTSSVLVSNIAFVLAGIFFYKLLRLDYSEKLSSFTVLLMAIFPTSYFFSSSYPESLFFLLFCLSFFTSDKKPILSGLFSSLANLTRPFGVFLLPSLGVEFLKKGKRTTRILTLALFFALSISIYMLINYSVYKDPFAFQKILRDHWQKSFAFPWQSIYQSWRVAVLSKNWGDYRIFVGFAEAITSTIAWIFVPLAFYKKFKIRLSYAIYYLLGVTLFTSTGFILSAPRYILSLPPFFIILAKVLKSKISKAVWITASTALLFYLTSICIKGQWAF